VLQQADARTLACVRRTQRASELSLELAREGRLTQIVIGIVDRPGQLASVSAPLAEVSANIVEVSHQRTFSDLPAKSTLLEVVIETRNRAHLNEVMTRRGRICRVAAGTTVT
jgi:threonine dehydratase